MKKLGLLVFLLGLVAHLSSCATELEGSAPTEGVVCGDSQCHVSEMGSCAQDCFVGAAVCGNGRCGLTETPESCPEDCGAGDDTPLDDLNNDDGDNGPCNYPGGPGQVAFGEIMPSLSWSGAFDEGGERVDLDMRDVFCGSQWDEYTSVAFIMGTGWCPACPDYIRHAAGLAEEARANGMLMVFVEAEDRNYSPVTNAQARDFLEPLLGGAPGLRIGDGDTEPTATTLVRSPVVTSFPAAWIVRRSDMKVIASQSRSQFILPFINISQDPDGEWGDAASDVPSNCGPDDEEIYEPNDDPKEAPAIEPGTFNGGVCGTAPDYYRVELDGPWRVDLEFVHNTGDLDMFVWDIDSGEPLIVDGQRVGSESISDNETIEFQGPATIMVFGFSFATAPYSLTLTDLSAQE